MRFPQIRSTFGVTPYNPERDPERARAIYEHYQDQVGTQPLPDESLPWNVPFEPGVAAQREFDDMLQRRVVDPLAQAGYEDLGAGLASVPSAAHSIIVPQTEMDLAGTIIPLPGVARAMKKGKFRKIRNAMKAESPDDVAEIIAKQAGKIPEKTIYQERGFGPTSIETEEWLAKISKLQGDEQKKSVKELLDAIGDEEANLNYVKNNLAARGIPIGNQTSPEIEERVQRIKASLSKIDELMEKLKKGEPVKTPLKVVEPPKPPKGEPKLTKEQFNQFDAEVDRLTDEIEQLNPSDPDYNIMLDKRISRLEEIEEITDKSIDAKKPKIIKTDAPKPPKGDPEAFLSPPPDRFAGIKSQLDVIPSRVDERGQAFGDVGSYDFRPNDEIMMQFEPIQKRNYVESELGTPLPDLYPAPKGRLFQQQYMDKKPDEIENLEVLIQKIGGQGPAHEASILQSKMYPPKPKEPEKFGQIKEQITEKSLKAEPKRPRLRVIKVGDGKDVTASFGVQENLAGMSADELQKIVDATGKRYKVIEEKYVPSGQKNTQGKYHVTDWAGNEIRELGTYDSTEDAYDEIVEWLRSKGVDEADLDLEVGEFEVRRKKVRRKKK